MGLEEDVGAAQGPQGEQAAEGSSSAEALAAAGQIMQLEGEARGCLDRFSSPEPLTLNPKP
jgi:ribosome biogenesis protein Tsr3